MSAFKHQVYFFLRRFLMAFVLIFFQKWFYAQFFIFNVLTFHQVCYLVTVQPFGKTMNRLELFNEVCILLSSTCFILFLETDVEALRVYSYLNLGIICVNLCANWTLNISVSMRACWKKYRGRPT